MIEIKCTGNSFLPQLVLINHLLNAVYDNVVVCSVKCLSVQYLSIIRSIKTIFILTWSYVIHDSFTHSYL